MNALLHRHGRILGPDPSVGPYCSIGGMVATNASGSLSLGYGSTMDNLESVVMVDGRGDVVRLPGDKKTWRGHTPNMPPGETIPQDFQELLRVQAGRGNRSRDGPQSSGRLGGDAGGS